MNKRICDYCGQNNPSNIIKLTRRPNNEDTYAELCDQCLTDITQFTVQNTEDRLRLPIPYQLWQNPNDTWTAVWNPPVKTDGLPERIVAQSSSSPYKAVQRLREKAVECGLLANQGEK